MRAGKADAVKVIARLSPDFLAVDDVCAVAFH